MTNPFLIGIGIRVMQMGLLVLRLTMLKTFLKHEGSVRLASLAAVVLVMK